MGWSHPDNTGHVLGHEVLRPSGPPRKDAGAGHAEPLVVRPALVPLFLEDRVHRMVPSAFIGGQLIIGHGAAALGDGV